MTDTLQIKHDEITVSLVCSECKSTDITRTISSVVSTKETYQGGFLVDSQVVDTEHLSVDCNKWECVACKHIWFDPPRRLKVKILPDEHAESPRDWDHLGTMICFHNRYRLGDPTALSKDMFNSWDELKGYIIEDYRAINILPLFLMEHGQLSISISPFDCPFDSGQVGFVYTTKERIDDFGIALDAVESFLVQEVKVYSQFLQRDVWGYVIEDEEGEHIDSCWGFIGRDCVEKEAYSVAHELSMKV